MEHLDGKLLLALGAGSLRLRPPRPAQGQTPADRRAETRTAERVDRRSAFQTMEQLEGFGLLAAPALLLGMFVHGASKKPPARAHATTRA